MFKSISLMLIGLLLNVNNVYSTSVGQKAFAKLEPCQQKCDQIFSIQKANPIDSSNRNLIACKGGCNILVQEGVTGEIGCEESKYCCFLIDYINGYIINLNHLECKQYYNVDTSLSACVKSCMNFAEKSVPAIEKPIITEIKKIDDSVEVKNVSPILEIDPVPAILLAKVPEEAKPEEKDSDSSSEEKKDDSSSSEEDKTDIEVESPIELFKDFFGSELIHGEPQVPPVNTKDSDAYLLNKNNDKDTPLIDDIVSIFEITRETGVYY